MKKGDYVNVPRFGRVQISVVFESRLEALMNGYREPTHYDDGEYGVYGKHVDTDDRGWVRFEFGAFKL